MQARITHRQVVTQRGRRYKRQHYAVTMAVAGHADECAEDKQLIRHEAYILSNQK